PNHSAVSGAPAAAVLERDGKCRHSTARSRLLPRGGRRAAQGEDSEAEGQALHGAGLLLRRPPRARGSGYEGRTRGIPSFFILLGSVLGLSPRTSAAPPGP